jgi:DNA-binding MarR family transcriptional regulator
LAVRDQVRELWVGLAGVNAVYDDFAKSVGLSYSSLYVLDVLHSSTAGCTQKAIAEVTFLPKQTVNAIVKGFLGDGTIEIAGTDGDRRLKPIRLTEAGRSRADAIARRMRAAECRALGRIPPERRSALLEGLRCFRDHLREGLAPETRVDCH